MAKGSDNKFPKLIITEGSAPSNADSGDQKLYIDSSDHKLKRKDSSGTVVSIEDAGSGAPTTSKYVTTAADGGLSAEVVIPGMAGNADIAGAAGAGVSYEFDSGSLPTWTSAVAAEDINTTIKSYYYASVTDNTERLAYYAWSPAGGAAFDARAKMTGGINTALGFNFGLLIMNSDNSVRAVIQIAYQLASAPYYTNVQAFTYASSTWTQRGVNWLVNPVSPVYYRITRDGSNNLTFWYGADGIGWQAIAVQALTFTVARIGFRIAGAAASTAYLACDWLRANV